MKHVILFILLVLFFAGCNKPSQQEPKQDVKQEIKVEKIDAVQMEKDMWANFGNKSYLEKMISDSFQSSHSDGAREKTAEIKLIQDLNVKKYDFSDFKTTQTGGTAVVTYFIAVTVTVDGKEITTQPSQRISTWIKTDKGWQWISHANLDPAIK